MIGSNHTGGSSRFEAFPDYEDALRREKLAYFRYSPTGKLGAPVSADLDDLVASGHVNAEPITYEDFLPVSAAGIFSSDLGDEGQHNHRQHAAKAGFERDLGAKLDDDDAAAARQSVEATWAAQFVAISLPRSQLER